MTNTKGNKEAATLDYSELVASMANVTRHLEFF